jgi:hypothetical protein
LYQTEVNRVGVIGDAEFRQFDESVRVGGVLGAWSCLKIDR